MKKYKKVLIDAILFFVIIGLTLYGVFHGEDLSGLKDAIKECNILWLIPAVPLVLFFIAGESIVIWHMLDCYGIYVKERLCFLFSAVGFFFSCVKMCIRDSGINGTMLHYVTNECECKDNTLLLLDLGAKYKGCLLYTSHRECRLHSAVPDWFCNTYKV